MKIGHCFLAAFLAMAANLQAVELKTSCENPGGWMFSVARTEDVPGREVFTISLKAREAAQPPTFDAFFTVDGTDAHNCWVPIYEENERSRLFASEWGTTRYQSALAQIAPICCAFNEADGNRLLIAASECMRTVRFGISCHSTDARLEGRFRFFTQPEAPRTDYEVRILVDRRPVFFGEAIAGATRWIEEVSGLRPCRVPEAAFDPLYSSWYAFWQDVHAADLEAEARLAVALGMKTMILDDGWQKETSKGTYSATGDWMPAKGRFPDFRKHVDAVHAAGIEKYLLWLSVPFVGEESSAYARFERMFLRKSDGVGILDPRFPEVRRYLVDTYVRCVKDWDFDGLKLDFIDAIDAGADDPAIAEGWKGRDCKTVSEGVDRLMKDVSAAVTAIKPDALIEFRQRYIGPGIRQYGNLLRATDCPSDLVGNRRRIADLRLTSGGTAVHSDMLVWSPSDTPEDAGRVIINAIFGVVQYSMRLATLPENHRRLIRHWIDFANRHRGALLKGCFRPHHPELMYPWIEAFDATERIVAVYGPNITVPVLDDGKATFVLNATKSATMAVDLAAAAEVTVYDAFGAKVRTETVAKGLRRIDCPVSGYLTFVATSIASGGVPLRVHNVFSSHMVVQRDRPVRVSGTAPAGAEVICSWWPDKAVTVKADAQGEWSVVFPARHRGVGSMNFGIKPWSGPQVCLLDVAVGEVWLATGQSNMHYSVGQLPEAKELIASLAKENDIRFLNAPRCSDKAGRWRDFAGTPAWSKVSDEPALREASAVGVYFALALRRELAARNDRTPIGIVMSNWGGTAIERWEVGTGDLWNAMLAPATEMNVRGAIWYQGCSNAAYPDAYRPKLHRLISDWSVAWRDPKFAFVLAELASYFNDRPKNPYPADLYMEFGPDQAWNTIGYAPFRQMQTEFLDRKDVGCSLTFDLGEQSNLHPTNKVGVGERMCREALRVAYGDKTILSAPRFDAVRREGDALVVSFKDVGEGLEAVGGKFAPHLWAVKGETADWTWAEAELRADNTVRVAAKGVEKPTGVQFAYMCYHGNVNFRRKGDGLPVFSFRRTLPTAVREEVPLFDGKDVRRWYSFVQAVGKTNVVEGLVRDGCLVFADKDSLSLTTINEFSDYRLDFKYRLGETGTNVAVVVHSFGNRGMVGNCAMEGESFSLTGVSAGSWHDASVVCRGDVVEFRIDGKLIKCRTGVTPAFGPIQFVGFGSSVSFRDVTLRPCSESQLPDSRPYVWWHWTGTAVTKEGIIRDLDAMLDAGIGGATIFQVARGPCSEVLAEGYEDDTNPALVFGNDAWCDMVAFAAGEAKKRGLEIGMHNCPGYTVSGGPWITPETAMKKLVWTSATKGTEPPQPETNLGFYREIGTVDVGDRTYRFGYTCTGSQCMPVAKALWHRCLEADKMSAKAVNLHLDNVLRRPLGLDFILMDSYEAGPYDWTDDFRAEFEKRRGYDPLPFLPAYVGAVSNDAEKIRADMAKTVKELSTERHYWIFRDRLHAAGLKFIVEPYGGPFDASEAAYASDMPTTEFWGRRPFWVKDGEIGAHPNVGGAAGRAAGRTILAAEAFTAMPFDDSYTVAPRDLKACADASFARGINRMLLHHWVHQPFPACRKPGNGMGYWGTHFGENQTWYEPGKAFFRYLRNCQEWLQRGEQVIDVLAVGDGFGNCDDVDVVPRRIYETDTETKDGKVRIISSGRTYSQVCLDPQDLKLPRRPFEVVSGVPVTPDGPVLGTARVDADGTRFFFVANVSTNSVTFTADFRATGVPELHDPERGRTGKKDVLSVKDGYSRLRLSLEAQESVVVVFRSASSLPQWEDRSVAGWAAQTLTAPWTVTFEPNRGAPTDSIELKELSSLSVHADARVRFFSGTATYRTRFVAKAGVKCEIDLGDVRDIARVRLNGTDIGVAWHFPFRVSADGALRDGENMLEVEVTNGWHNRLLGDKALPDDCEWGPLRKHQCAMDGSEGVCGKGLKRIPDWAWKADGRRPSTNRVAFTTWDYFTKGGELMPSGLIGPVRILTPGVRDGKKVLMIGNSFSQSVLTRLPAVAAADGEDLDISNLMIGGCVLSRHVSNIVAYAKDPTFKPYTWPRYRNGKFVGRTKTNIPEALAADKWDIVTIQQGSSACYQADSYHPWGDELVAAIRKYAPQAKIMVQQTWSYNELNRCIHDPYTGGPGWFGIDRDTMYRNLTSNYYAFAEKYGFEVIPTGNAVELFRHRQSSSDPSEDVVGRFPKPKTGWFDLIHLNDRGCELQAYVWYKALFGKDPRKLPKVKDERDRLLREVAFDVFSKPPLSIEPYPANAADYAWKTLYSGTAEELPHGGATPDAFRATARVQAKSGRAGLVCGTSSLTLAADGTVTAAWADKDGVAQTRTFVNILPKGGAADLRLVRVNGGTALWHFILNGKILFGADSVEESPDGDGRFSRLGIVAEGGAFVGPVTLEQPIVK